MSEWWNINETVKVVAAATMVEGIIRDVGLIIIVRPSKFDAARSVRALERRADINWSAIDCLYLFVNFDWEIGEVRSYRPHTDRRL